MDKVRIGSAGLGRLGMQHAQNIADKVPDADLVALCDPDERKLGETADRLGVKKTYTDFSEMAKDPDLDAVVVVSPSALHPAQIELALDAGKHVFSEKPLGTTAAGCKAAEAAVERHPD